MWKIFLASCYSRVWWRKEKNKFPMSFADRRMKWNFFGRFILTTSKHFISWGWAHFHRQFEVNSVTGTFERLSLCFEAWDGGLTQAEIFIELCETLLVMKDWHAEDSARLFSLCKLLNGNLFSSRYFVKIQEKSILKTESTKFYLLLPTQNISR